MTRKVLVLAAAIAAALAPRPASCGGSGPVVWVEAEGFAECGGWSNDPQFVDIMGSPYLLATGLGHAVADAVTRVRIPRDGTYRLWVRCRDWLPPHSPGRFQVIVGGRPSQTLFGRAEDDRWRWIDGGTFALSAGPVEVRLHDRTGWWGRCDAVALSADPGFRPADDLEELAAQREAFGGVAREVRERGPYDVVVVGGGLAGSAAAVAAARLGRSVALIQDRPILGGNASREIGVPPQGDQSREPLDPRETGIIEEFEPKRGERGDWSASIERVVRAEPGIDLFLQTRATGVVMDEAKAIRAVEALHVREGTRWRFTGRIFIDCTGDGWVGYWAGAPCRHGREGRAEHGESLAPPEPDAHTMGNTLYAMAFRTHEEPVPFEAPPWAYDWPSCDAFETRPMGSAHTDGVRPPSWADMEKGRGRHPTSAFGGHRTWWVELGGMRDTIRDAERIRDELLRVNLGLWDHVKNHCPRFAEANRKAELVWMNYVPGKRESRRLLGDYVMTQRDYTERTVHPDTVAYGGWMIDLHHPQGFFARGPEAFFAYRYKVSIPYRCLYSRAIDNLMMAGRDVSVSHVALGGVRVMRTTCVMGQAAGTAAAIACQRYTTPRGVYQRHLDELQDRLLKDGCYLMGRPNRDPHDLARSAAVAASGFAAIPDPRRYGARPGRGGLVHELNTARAVMFTAGSDRLDAIALYLASSRAEPAKLRAVLRPAGRLGDFSSRQDLAAATATVPPQRAGWVAFDLKAKLAPGRPYYVALPRAAGIAWHLYPLTPKGTARAYGGPDWTRMEGCYKFRLEPGGEPAEAGAVPYELHTIRLVPENATNGWNRAVGGVPNAWGPDPTEPLPQWIELDFRRPVAFNAVHVTFQLASMAASAYRLDVPRHPEGWRTILRIEGNRARRGVHGFPRIEARRLRLVIEKGPPGDAPTRICEIRVYDEPAP